MKTVIVNDKMQKGYKYYLTEPMEKNFDPDFSKLVFRYGMV